jgi:hypothetical protein
MEHDTPLPYIQAGFRICRCGSCESIEEARLEVLDRLKPGTELRVDCWPRNSSWLAQPMTTPCEPNTDVETHGAVA